MRRVLFVDEDEATREIYQQLQSYWGIEQEVHTAGTAIEAINLMGQLRFAVVVSELSLPDMPGLEFLSKIMESHPEAARIVISANNDSLKAAEALNVAHRFFSKPFSFEVLGSLLENLGQYHYLLHDERIQCMIFKTGALPVLPGTWVQLTGLLDSADTDISDIAKIVEQDPGLTTRLLHTVNSAYFGIARRVVSCSEAIQIVGLELIRGLMMGMKIFDFYKNSPFVRTVFGRIWDHSLRTATGARRLCELETQSIETCNVAFTAGLLHDIGKLILAANAEEKEKFGTTHAQIGAYLFTLWGFPDQVVRAVENHHNLEGIEKFSPALAIHAAQCLQRGGEYEKQLNLGILAQLGLAERVDLWRDRVSTTLI
jgi:putative nucleotidyltransferase with HDIG domain